MNNWRKFAETHKNSFRLLKVVGLLDRDVIPLTILLAVMEMITPYITIILSARIVDLLLSAAYGRAIRLAIIMTVIVLGIQCLAVVLEYHVKMKRGTLQSRLEVLVRKKGLELDSATMEDSEVLSAIRNAENAINFTGGLPYLVKAYQEVLQNVLKIITSMALTVMLCLSRPLECTGALKLFVHPAVTAVCLAVAWLLGTGLTRRKLGRIKEEEAANDEKHYQVESQLGYWLHQVFSSVESGKTIRVNGMQQLLQQNFREMSKEDNQVFDTMGEFDQRKTLAEALESVLFSVTAYMMVLLKVLAGAITIGSFAQYSGALLQFNQACSKLRWSELEIDRIVKPLVPLADFLERTSAMAEGSLHVEKRNDHVYELEFHDVGFCYPGSQEFSLRHVSGKLTLKKRMAVVGPNGAGKTTFIKLLCRLYDPTEGFITLNGIDIRKYDLKEYQRLFGVVFQDFHLFAAPINENVAAGDTVDRARAAHCLAQAGVLDFVNTLPNGADTVIEKGTDMGVDLSGGQEQKIAIARALYKDASFVILDEPTAALDPISEAEIYERFHEMVADKTSVYISHRMSSCRFCDEILVFDRGAVVERGTHEELLERQGLYQRLWTAQAQYYIA